MINENIYQKIKLWLNSKKTVKHGTDLFQMLCSNYERIKIKKMSLHTRMEYIEKFLLEKKKIFEIDLNLKQEPVNKEHTEQKNHKKKITAQQALEKEFPKIIFSELPDTLKLLVFKRFDTWNKAVKFHKQQHEATTDDERFKVARNCILSMSENWKIWDELNHWHKYKRPLKKHTEFEHEKFIKKIQKKEQSVSITELTKYLIEIRKKSRSNINFYNRKKDLEISQKKRRDLWIWKFNVVSQKLNEPLWDK